ncbi:MAG: HEPN domain-containing protein [Nitrospirae bacterium]|nr:HEPN domain-containing protein [Nitrospirota bacterium]
MHEDRNIIVKKWFSKADNDLKNIENNLTSKDIPADTLCFHSQQAIEKLIKGSLVYFEQDISKTHDLVKLLTEITPFIPELSPLEEDMERISEFAVETRYPDAFYEPSLEEAKEAYKVALKVKEIVLDKIKI